MPRGSPATITLTFTHVATAFDTCEFGPDFNLPGALTVAQRATTTGSP